MTTIQPEILYVQTAPSLAVAESVLSALRGQGVEVLRWSVSSHESHQSQLSVEYVGDRGSVSTALRGNDGVFGFDVWAGEESIQIELVLVRVMATERMLDEAAEIIGTAGGRLLSLSSEGFSAQISGRPEKIESMLTRLAKTAPVEVVRSGRLSVQK